VGTNFIVVNRFSQANGVGNAAISLYEYLSKKHSEIIVVCMRSDSDYAEFSNIHRFPFKIPYSLEIFVLPCFAALHSRRQYIKHSFEVLLFKPNFFHIHFDHKIKKGRGGKNLHNVLAREFATKISRIAYKIALIRRAKIIAPSNLLIKQLQLDNKSSSCESYALPNCISEKDFSYLKSTHRSQGNNLIDFNGKVCQKKNVAALLANGDFDFKGLNRIDEIFRAMPSDWDLLIVGVGKNFEIPAKYQSRIRTMNRISRKEVWKLFETLTGVVVASSFESFSMVALEAIVQGVPVLSLGPIGIQEFYDEYVRLTGVKSLLLHKEFEFVPDRNYSSMENRNNQIEFQTYLLNKRQEVFNEMNL
jgi:hypothetical protein